MMNISDSALSERYFHISNLFEKVLNCCKSTDALYFKVHAIFVISLYYRNGRFQQSRTGRYIAQL